IPDKATVQFRFDQLPPLVHECDVARDTGGVGRLATRVDAGRLPRTFRFQVFAHDASTPEYEVQVLPPPVLVPLDGKPSPQLRLWPPAYTDLPAPQDLPPGTGELEAVNGTRIVLRAAADRPLRHAWIEYQRDNRLPPLAAFLGSLGG